MFTRLKYVIYSFIRLFICFFISFLTAKNPPPICFGIPRLRKLASLCVDLYKLTFSEHFGGCVAIEAKLFFMVVARIPIGCFYSENAQTTHSHELQGSPRTISELGIPSNQKDQEVEPKSKAILIV